MSNADDLILGGVLRRLLQDEGTWWFLEDNRLDISGYEEDTFATIVLAAHEYDCLKRMHDDA